MTETDELQLSYALAAARLPDTTQRPVPDAEALCVYRKLRFGESIPSLWVVLAPAPMTEGLIHLSGGQLAELCTRIFEIERLWFVTRRDDQLMVLRAVNTEPQGTFGLLLNPEEFEQTLEGMLGRCCSFLDSPCQSALHPVVLLGGSNAATNTPSFK